MNFIKYLVFFSWLICAAQCRADEAVCLNALNDCHQSYEMVHQQFSVQYNLANQYKARSERAVEYIKEKQESDLGYYLMMVGASLAIGFGVGQMIR